MATIPKTIHYVWVGPRTPGALVERCIASWRQFLPEYTIQKWDESNSPMDHPYVQEMYRQKKWAFVSDYIRFWALYNYGGVYLDTDTEVLKSFDSLLKHDVFFGKTKDGMTAAGVIGAVPQQKCIKDILSVYDADDTYSTRRTSPRTITDVLEEHEYAGVTVYSYEYFNPCDDGEKCTTDKLALAYTNNHWAESWVPFAKFRKILRRFGMMSIFKTIFRR